MNEFFQNPYGIGTLILGLLMVVGGHSATKIKEREKRLENEKRAKAEAAAKAAA